MYYAAENVLVVYYALLHASVGDFFAYTCKCAGEYRKNGKLIERIAERVSDFDGRYL